MDNPQNKSDGPLMSVPYGSWVGARVEATNTGACAGYINGALWRGTGGTNNEANNIAQITADTTFTFQCLSAYDGSLHSRSVLVRPLLSGTVNILSNLNTSWTVTGASSFSGSGNSDSRTGVPHGVYTITPANVPGYSWTVSPCLSQNLSNNPSCN